MTTVRRCDIGTQSKVTKTPEGWLRVEGRLTRTGVFTYRDHEGKERKELRLPDEVFAKESLDSFALVPVTDDHPPEWLGPANTKQWQVGTVGEVVRTDGEFVQAKMMVTDAKAIEHLEKKSKVQLSCGYVCELDPTPGEWNGQRYDCVQKNIRGNHVAIVAKGRAGPEVRVRLDAADTDTSTEATASPNKEAMPMVKIRIDGVDYEVSEAGAQAVSRLQQQHADALQKAKDDAAAKASELAKLQAKTDALAEDLKKAEHARKDAEDPKRLRSAINARVALEQNALALLGKETKFDSMSDEDIRKAIICKAYPQRKLDGKSAEYIEAAYEGALEKLDADAEEQNDGIAKARAAGHRAQDADDEDPELTAYAAMKERNRNAWKGPQAAK